MLFALVVTFMVLVCIHELGHYLAARYFGVTPPVFSIGFGPSIYHFTRGETEIRICLLPLGGYVQIPSEPIPPPKFLTTTNKVVQILLIPLVIPLVICGLVLRALAPTKKEQEPFQEDSDSNTLPPEPDRSNWLSERGPWAEFCVSFAGPLANLILAFGLFFVAAVSCQGLGFAEAIVEASAYILDSSTRFFTLLGQIVTGTFSLELMGPFEQMIKSSQMMDSRFKELGGVTLRMVLVLAGSLNVILAVANLLPLPGLDGSGILLAGVRTMASPRNYQLARTVVAFGGILFLGGLFTASLAKDVVFFTQMAFA